MLSPFSGPPFTVPPGATFNGQPLPASAGYFFSTYGGASETFQQVVAAIIAAGGSLLTPQNTPQGASPLAIVDGIASGDYAEFGLPTPPTEPYLPTMIGLWIIKGNFMGPNGLCFENDIAGLIEKRSVYPNQPTTFGDKNLMQVGSGATARMVGVPSSLAIQILPETPASLASAYWGPPA